MKNKENSEIEGKTQNKGGVKQNPYYLDKLYTFIILLSEKKPAYFYNWDYEDLEELGDLLKEKLKELQKGE